MPSYSTSVPEVCEPPLQSMEGSNTSGSGMGNAGMLSRALGGARYRIVSGDTLSSISRRTYGSSRYWRNIMSANPDQVFRDGDLIIVDHELVLPLISVPAEESESEEEELETATAPRGICNDWGNFEIYPDDFVGPLPGISEEGIEHVREGELTVLLTERQAAAETERTEAVATIEELLTRDWTDWAITDSEATRALNLLGNLHFTQIGPALDALGSDRVSDLLDNLPDEMRQTAAFCKVVVALGPSAARPYIEEVLSLGLFDWAVTDGDIDAICAVLSLLPADEQAELVLGLSQAFQVRFAVNLHSDAAISSDLLQQLFDSLPDTELDALGALLGARFHFEAGGRGWGNDWTAESLRQAWVLLAQLPPGNVEDNDLLDLFLRGGTSDGSGYYRASDDSAVIEFADLAATGGYGKILVDDGTGNEVDVGLHTSINLFNTVVRHEIGHAVDAKLGVSGAGGFARTAANAGQWEEFGGATEWKQGIIDAAGGFSGHGYADEAKYEQAFHRSVDDEEDFNDALQAIDASLALATAASGGPVRAVYNLDRWHPDKSPWYDNPNRPGVNGRVFHKAYGHGRWVSYTRTARQQYGVSGYQWRAPGEWFAEAYACYYSDHDGPAGDPVGTRLRTRDPLTADFFDRDIDQGHSLALQTQQAGGAGGGAGGGGAGPS